MKNKKIDYGWIFKIVLSTFIISIIFTLISEIAIPNVTIVLGIIICIIFIAIGVIFDMVGVAITTCDEKKLHSMASNKIKGAKTAIKFKKNADKMSSFCNDVIGDVCGIVSGSTATVIAIKILEKTNFNELVATVIIMGVVSSLTIGGKALEKSFAIKKSTTIVYHFSKIISLFIGE